MKKYIVIKNRLNIRSSANDISDANFVGELQLGATLFLKDEVVIGKVPKAGKSNVWLVDANNNLVASEGVRPFHASDEPSQYASLQFNYNQLVNVPPAVALTKGQGVRIAIIDTGCYDEHEALTGAVIAKYDAVSEQKGQAKDESAASHGTFIAGLIAGGQTQTSEIIGVAPMAELIMIKATAYNDINAKEVLQALKWILTLDKAQMPHIINLSLDFFEEDKEGEFRDLFEKFVKKGITVIAAGASGASVFSSVFYPAAEQDVLGVGAVNQSQVISNSLYDGIDYVVPMLRFYSALRYKDKYGFLEGSSMSTAILSGVYALFLSYLQLQTQGLRDKIDQSLPRFDKNTFTDKLKIFKR